MTLVFTANERTSVLRLSRGDAVPRQIASIARIALAASSVELSPPAAIGGSPDSSCLGFSGLIAHASAVSARVECVTVDGFEAVCDFRELVVLTTFEG